MGGGCVDSTGRCIVPVGGGAVGGGAVGGGAVGGGAVGGCMQVGAGAASHGEVMQRMAKAQRMAAIMTQPPQQQPQLLPQLQPQLLPQLQPLPLPQPLPQPQPQPQLAAAPGVLGLPTGPPGLAGGPSSLPFSGLAGLPTFAPGNWQQPAGQCTPTGQWGPGSAFCQQPVPVSAVPVPAQPI
jgi:hypothetical protein